MPLVIEHFRFVTTGIADDSDYVPVLYSILSALQHRSSPMQDHIVCPRVPDANKHALVPHQGKGGPDQRTHDNIGPMMIVCHLKIACHQYRRQQRRK